MEEFEIKPEVPREVLLKDGASALAYLLGGMAFMAIAISARFPGLGIILSGFSIFFGLKTIMTKEKEESKSGFVLLGGGTLGLFLRFGPAFLRPFAAFFLSLGALALFAAGIWKGVKFLIGLKSRQ